MRPMQPTPEGLTYVIGINVALSIALGVMLWLVWRRDRSQAFARDMSWVQFFSFVAPAFSYAYFSQSPILQGVGMLGIAVGQTLGYTFLVVATRRLSGANPLGREKLSIAATLFILFGSMVTTRDPTLVYGVAAGMYIAIGILTSYWLRSHRVSDRVIGLLLLVQGMNLLIVVFQGEKALALQMGGSIVIRVMIVFAFAYAALDRSAAAMQQARERFERLSESALQGIVVLDENQFFYANPAALTIYGYASFAAMQAAGPWATGSPENKAIGVAAVRRALGGERRMTEIAGNTQRPDGTSIYVRYTGWPTDWDGHPAVQVLVTDETAKFEAQREAERTQALLETNAQFAIANSQLSSTLDTLQRTQTEIVQQEKLASLGRMVAGIAHELNTPIGNALTTGSALGEMARRLQADIQAGQLKKSMLDEFVQSSVDGAVLLEKSLRRADELINNFKHVAAEQTTESLSTFDLADALDGLESGLRTAGENTPVELQFTIPSGIEMHSYPALLGQVIAHLINNAMVHAFEGLEQGLLEVTATLDGTHVVLAVRDNGCGIGEDIVKRIFDPFFTTRMGRGMGLGLHRVHTIVTNTLGGTIDVIHQQPHGTLFQVRVPMMMDEGTLTQPLIDRVQ